MTDTGTDALFLALGGVIRKEFSAAQLLERFVDAMAGQLQADRGTVFLLDENGTELVSIAAHLPEMKEIRVPLSQGVAGYVARTGKIANIPNNDENLPIWREIDQQTGYTTHSMLAGPLYDKQGHLIGVVQLLNKKNGTFHQQDEEVFQTLSKQVATLLEETTLSRGPNYVETEPEPSAETSLPNDVPFRDRFNRIVGTSGPMRTVFQLIHRVAPTEANVLLRGESGTGKSLIARALHHNSPRSNGPLVHVDCTTLPEGLMENELFGHERGAYTGAHAREKGKVESADKGTLFLDEIGDLPPPLQGKLLTLIQERSYRRVGGTQMLHADIRIIAATNRPLEHLVQAGQFREDLYFRLRVVQIDLPPLRQRGREDLLRLINHFVAEASRRHKRPIQRIRHDALEMLLAYPWPGNVRELENCLESAVIFSDGEITPSALPLARPFASHEPHSYTNLHAISHTTLPGAFAHGPAPIHMSSLPVNPFSPAGNNVHSQPTTQYPAFQGHAAPILPNDPTHLANHPFADEPTLQELESRYIQYLLERHQNNRSATARILGIGRNTLLRKIKDYHLE